MGTYTQLQTPDGSMADVSSLGTGKLADTSGDPSDNDIEEDSVEKVVAVAVEKAPSVIEVEDDDCLGWHGMMGQWPLVMCFWFILVGGGVGICFSLLMKCAQYVYFVVFFRFRYVA